MEFENLAPVELGALLWSLDMDGKGFHRLGFAKPLGFGSVRVQVTTVALLSVAERYGTLSRNGWQPPVANWQSKYVEVFKSALARRYRKGFEELDNIQDLRSLLSEPPGSLPIHYPRSSKTPDPKGRNFEWFLGNNRSCHYTLPPAASDQGLPLIQRDGTEL